MIILKNKGEIELDLIKTMGVNVKEGSSIGYFGTGLKYAIAVFLREEIEFSIFIGENKYDFYTNEKTIRGKQFKFCCMKSDFDFIELGFTTDLGKNWELWQAYREIHSNCLDEQGFIKKSSKPTPQKGHTTICIDIDIDIDSIFLNTSNKELIFSDSSLEIYKGESPIIYYRGIRAKDLSRPSTFTYNIKKTCTLTEDRLLAYDWKTEEVINDAVAQMRDPDLIKLFIDGNGSCYESSLSMGFNNTVKPSQEFIETVIASKSTANSTAISFAESHLPKSQQTKSRQMQDFISEIASLCETYDVDFDQSDSEVVIELSGF